MPQIIKTVGEASLTGSSVPLWFTDLKHAPDRVPGYADYYALADDGIVYVCNDNDGVVDNSGETQLLNVGNIL